MNQDIEIKKFECEIRALIPDGKGDKKMFRSSKIITARSFKDALTYLATLYADENTEIKSIFLRIVSADDEV